MADVKWIKLNTDMFDNAKIKYLRTLPQGESIVLIWVMLLTKAGYCNSNGYIFLTENIPYTHEMLASEFGFELNVIRLALISLQKLNMIQLKEEKILISSWSEHQNIDGLEKIREQTKKRVAKYRQQKKLKDSNVSCNVTVTESNAIDKEKEEEIDKDIYSISKDILVSKNLIPIVEEWNNLNLSKVKSVKGNRLKILNARIKEYGIDSIIEAIKSINKSSFLKGQNNKNWIITFDWLIKPNNFPKVLEGNYIDKEGVNSATNITKDNETSSKPKYDFSCFE